MGRSRPAVGDEDAVAGIVAEFDGRLGDEIGHLRVNDPEHAEGGFLGRQSERCAERGERLDGGVTVQAHPAAEEVVGVQVAEHDVGIGDGGPRPSEAVARWAGRRPCALGSDPQETPLVQPADAAAAGSDSGYEDLGHPKAVLRHDGLVIHGDLPPKDQADIE